MPTVEELTFSNWIVWFASPWMVIRVPPAPSVAIATFAANVRSVIPKALIRYLSDPDHAKAGRVTQAMLKMKKIDVAALNRAASTP